MGAIPCSGIYEGVLRPGAKQRSTARCARRMRRMHASGSDEFRKQESYGNNKAATPRQHSASGCWKHTCAQNAYALARDLVQDRAVPVLPCLPAGGLTPRHAMPRHNATPHHTTPRRAAPHHTHAKARHGTSHTHPALPPTITGPTRTRRNLGSHTTHAPARTHKPTPTATPL